MAQQAASDRTALQAIRGVALGAHAIAGLQREREVERLVRAAEGMLRTAAAVLGASRPRPGTGAADDTQNTMGGSDADLSRAVRRRQRQAGASSGARAPGPSAEVGGSGGGQSRSAIRRRKRRLATAAAGTDSRGAVAGGMVKGVVGIGMELENEEGSAAAAAGGRVGAVPTRAAVAAAEGDPPAEIEMAVDDMDDSWADGCAAAARVAVAPAVSRPMGGALQRCEECKVWTRLVRGLDVCAACHDDIVFGSAR